MVRFELDRFELGKLERFELEDKETGYKMHEKGKGSQSEVGGKDISQCIKEGRRLFCCVRSVCGIRYSMSKICGRAGTLRGR